MKLTKTLLIAASVLGLSMAACDSGQEGSEIEETQMEGMETSQEGTMTDPAGTTMGDTMETETLDTQRRPASVEGQEIDPSLEDDPSIEEDSDETLEAEPAEGGSY